MKCWIVSRSRRGGKPQVSHLNSKRSTKLNQNPKQMTCEYLSRHEVFAKLVSLLTRVALDWISPPPDQIWLSLDQIQAMLNWVWATLPWCCRWKKPTPTGVSCSLLRCPGLTPPHATWQPPAKKLPIARAYTVTPGANAVVPPLTGARSTVGRARVAVSWCYCHWWFLTLWLSKKGMRGGGKMVRVSPGFGFGCFLSRCDGTWVVHFEWATRIVKDCGCVTHGPWAHLGGWMKLGRPDWNRSGFISLTDFQPETGLEPMKLWGFFY
jgi:hypothetical protein